MIEYYKTFLAARYLSEDLHQASAIEAYSEPRAQFHERAAHRHFRELAEAMGYDVTKREVK